MENVNEDGTSGGFDDDGDADGVGGGGGGTGGKAVEAASAAEGKDEGEGNGVPRLQHATVVTLADDEATGADVGDGEGSVAVQTEAAAAECRQLLSALLGRHISSTKATVAAITAHIEADGSGPVAPLAHHSALGTRRTRSNNHGPLVAKSVL